jgi:hypothetical protein
MIRVILQDERGIQIGDGEVDLQSSIFPDERDSRFNCLRFVDQYGDTIFNRLQSEHLKDDLRLLSNECNDEETRSLLLQVIVLANLCSTSPHSYIRFIGD